LPRVLVVGYNAFDVICPLRELPARDTKHEVDDIILSGGGPAATAAVALSRLGASVRLVTRLGDDLPSQLQRHELIAAGVNLVLSPGAGGHGSPRSVIMVEADHAARTILWSRGTLPLLEPGEMDVGWLEGCDLLYVDSHEPVAAVVLAREARRRGLPVVLDGGTARPGLAALVACCTDVISSRIFAPALTGQHQPVAALHALAARGPRRVAMTFGEAGCLALSGGRIHHVPAFAVAVKDTTGAGDAFHAGYAYARGLGLGWLECLDYGSAVAALKCRDWGGRRGLPTREEVASLLREGTRRQERPPDLPD
jgi:sulfofructose kinase